MKHSMEWILRISPRRGRPLTLQLREYFYPFMVKNVKKWNKVVESGINFYMFA